MVYKQIMFSDIEITQEYPAEISVLSMGIPCSMISMVNVLKF